MTPPIRGLGQIGGGIETDIGLSIMQLGMITGLHAAISPSFFTFACFAKKPEECEIAKKTLWISLIATTIVNAGVLLAFKRWAPAITGQLVGTGLFIGGMMAVKTDSAPAAPSMAPKPEAMAGRIRNLGYIGPRIQPEILVGQDHWLDRDYPDRYSEWWVGEHARR